MTAKLVSALVTAALVSLTTGAGAHAASRPRADRPAVHAAVPLRGELTGLHVSRTPVAPPVVFDRFEAAGTSTLLGRFDVVIEATVDFGARPVTGTGTYTFTSADGDLLVAEHHGASALVRPGTVLITEHATVDPDRSTGRFAGATGEFTVERLADAATGVGGVTSGSITGAVVLAPGR